MPKTRTFLIALVTLFVLPAAASASVTLGPESPNPEPLSSQAVNFPGGTVVFTADPKTGTVLAAPADGVVTSWQFYVDDVGPEAAVQLRMLVPTGGKNYKLVGAGPVEPIAESNPSGPEDHNVRHVFATRVSVAAGQLLGVGIIHPSGSSFIEPVLPVELGVGWKYGCLGCGTPIPGDGSPSEAVTVEGQWVAMNARLEPDADRDGYGDETQDSCVGVCAPPAPISTVVTPPTPKKKCKKGKKLKRGKCVKKHKKRHKKPKK